MRLSIYPDGGVSRLRLHRTRLKRLDALPRGARRSAALLRCCGSRRWAEAMERGAALRRRAALVAAAERAFGAPRREDWLEAFSHHPRIGDRGVARRALRRRRPRWSASRAGRRGGTRARTCSTRSLRGNREYEARFGHIFIVCATGKTAAEMLALLRARLANEPAAELEIAAAEQRKITASASRSCSRRALE